mmetsp:Transcript_168138/g.540076  ORF Transcript_168138/g.540076 Transcript_168138/m.540076 type:complete len:353 (+) Transcript_168138:306-1364(+)
MGRQPDVLPAGRDRHTRSHRKHIRDTRDWILRLAPLRCRILSGASGGLCQGEVEASRALLGELPDLVARHRRHAAAARRRARGGLGKRPAVLERHPFLVPRQPGDCHHGRGGGHLWLDRREPPHGRVEGVQHGRVQHNRRLGLGWCFCADRVHPREVHHVPGLSVETRPSSLAHLLVVLLALWAVGGRAPVGRHHHIGGLGAGPVDFRDSPPLFPHGLRLPAAVRIQRQPLLPDDRGDARLQQLPRLRARGPKDVPQARPLPRSELLHVRGLPAPRLRLQVHGLLPLRGRRRSFGSAAGRSVGRPQGRRRVRLLLEPDTAQLDLRTHDRRHEKPFVFPRHVHLHLADLRLRF